MRLYIENLLLRGSCTPTSCNGDGFQQAHCSVAATYSPKLFIIQNGCIEDDRNLRVFPNIAPSRLDTYADLYFRRESLKRQFSMHLPALVFSEPLQATLQLRVALLAPPAAERRGQNAFWDTLRTERFGPISRFVQPTCRRVRGLISAPGAKCQSDAHRSRHSCSTLAPFEGLCGESTGHRSAPTPPRPPPRPSRCTPLLPRPTPLLPLPLPAALLWHRVPRLWRTSRRCRCSSLGSTGWQPERRAG